MKKIKKISRKLEITKNFTGRLVKLSDGRRYRALWISKADVSHKFGELSFTKKTGSCIHVKKKGKKRNLKLRKKR